MTEMQIKEHEEMKKKHISYPQLPKFIQKRNDKSYVQPNEGLRKSCIMGFYSRLENWHKQNTPDYDVVSL